MKKLMQILLLSVIVFSLNSCLNDTEKPPAPTPTPSPTPQLNEGSEEG